MPSDVRIHGATLVACKLHSRMDRMPCPPRSTPTISARRKRSSCSSSTSSPTTTASRSPWSAAKARYVWDSEGQPLSRLLSRLGLQPAGPLPAAGRRGRAGAGGHADPRAQHLAHGGAGPLGPDALASGASAARRSSATRGTEANEAAIKLARLHTPRDRYKIITFTGGFHGRTLGRHGRHRPAQVSRRARPADGRLSSTLRSAIWTPSTKLIDDETCAILVEPIQGEGGIRIPPAGFLAGPAEAVPTSTACC